MTHRSDEELVTLDYRDVDDLWTCWASQADEDVLAQAAFERTLRFALDLQDDGLYFRPGGWKIDLPASVARVACVAAILGAAFHIAGFPDVDKEIVIAAAGLLASMDVRPVRPGRREQRLADTLRQKNLDGKPITASQARKALPKASRRRVSDDEIADALDLLVDAGIADRDSHDQWILRAEGSDAWIRLRLGRSESRLLFATHPRRNNASMIVNAIVSASAPTRDEPRRRHGAEDCGQ